MRNCCAEKRKFSFLIDQSYGFYEVFVVIKIRHHDALKWRWDRIPDSYFFGFCSKRNRYFNFWDPGPPKFSNFNQQVSACISSPCARVHFLNFESLLRMRTRSAHIQERSKVELFVHSASISRFDLMQISRNAWGHRDRRSTRYKCFTVATVHNHSCSSCAFYFCMTFLISAAPGDMRLLYEEGSVKYEDISFNTSTP